MWEAYKARFGLAVIVGFLVSAWCSWQEFRYGCWGQTVEATVTNVSEGREYVRRGRYRSVLKVDLQYPLADGTPQTAELKTSINSPIDVGHKVAVRYVPGASGMVRFSEDRNVFAVIFFFGCLIALAGFIFWAAMEANRPYGAVVATEDDRPVAAKLAKPKKKRPLKPLKPLEPGV
jgi:hypothetical protein